MESLPRNILMPLTMAALTIFLFWREFSQLLFAWINDPFVRYGVLIPPISFYMIWKRREGLGIRLTNANVGAALAVLSIPMIFIIRDRGSLSLAVFAFLPFVFGVATAGYSFTGIRRIWFPLAYLGFMFPLPTIITTPLSLWMSRITYYLTLFWLDIFGAKYISSYDALPTICVYSQGEPLRFALDISCVSIYSLIGFLAFGVFFGYVVSGRLYRRILLVFTGALLLVLLNSMRIAGILGLAIIFGEGLAVNLFHLLGGWVLIAMSFLIVLLLMERTGVRINL